MAGIYIHIPFCAKRCLYCDFFSTTELKQKPAYIEAVCRELLVRKDYLGNETVETVYFGGGTPSQLTTGEYKQLLDTLEQVYGLAGCHELTIEANPDDITPAYLQTLRSLPINRISMGIQSFKDSDLHFLNRRHTAAQAIQAVASCKEAGLTNISIDLMYGLPGQTLADWQKNIDTAIQLDIPHLSAYHLIYEEGTQLYKLLQAGKVHPVDEENSLMFFKMLTRQLKKAGYEHYEISNFARPGFISNHNSSYWKGVKYLGVGASAHSYNGISRQWNTALLSWYIAGIQTGKPVIEIEELTGQEKYNDYIITRLRTMWGIGLEELTRLFGEKKAAYCLQQAKPYLERKLLLRKGDTLALSEEGIFLSDGIMSDLLMV
ncbi:MAG: radical SAM family heme chaperone HemW [Tannerellaceae bacterium]|nr:radical SAM family heme chaperone HemW [Tannerellaceae bacterium]